MQPNGTMFLVRSDGLELDGNYAVEVPSASVNVGDCVSYCGVSNGTESYRITKIIHSFEEAVPALPDPGTIACMWARIIGTSSPRLGTNGLKLPAVYAAKIVLVEPDIASWGCQRVSENLGQGRKPSGKTGWSSQIRSGPCRRAEHDKA